MSIRNFSFVVDGVLAGSAHPIYTAAGDLAPLLQEFNIGAVVSLDQPGLPADYIAGLGSEMRYLHLQIPDFTPPEPEQIDQFIDFVDEMRAAEKATLAHCYAGMGRTGTMLAAYMVKEFGITADEAINRLRRERPGSIETPGQEDAVRSYARRLKNRNAR